MAATNAIVTKPTFIEYNNLRFLISDAPKDSNLHLYLKEFKKYNVTHLVRISEPSYNKEELENAGIQVHEMYFDDGASPPEELIDQWLDLVSATFNSKAGADNPSIAVHCVAGLGRAPVLVALALIENGLDSISAVAFIRERRRGAINAVQLAYLESYQPKKKKKCCIM